MAPGIDREGVIGSRQRVICHYLVDALPGAEQAINTGSVLDFEAGFGLGKGHVQGDPSHDGMPGVVFG